MARKSKKRQLITAIKTQIGLQAIAQRSGYGRTFRKAQKYWTQKMGFSSKLTDLQVDELILIGLIVMGGMY
ncbi:MAG TPA: hypothetical protein V6D27_01015 [Vampirovibrionales bacterium]